MKNWIDTTPPVVACPATTNPSGTNVPQAGDNPASGQNPDGFYEVTTSDAVDPNPTITVHDTASSATFGPFASGTKLKLTQAPHVDAPVLRAMAMQASSALSLHRGDPRAAIDAAQQAASAWAGLEAPYEHARSRLLEALAATAFAYEHGLV